LPDVDDTMMAFTIERAAELSAFSPRQLRRFENQMLVVPSVIRPLSPRNTVRLYSVMDIQSLLVVRALRSATISPQQIRKVVDRARAAYQYTAPLNELKFALVGHEVHFQHPDGTWEGGRRPGQIVLWQVIDLRAIRSAIRAAAVEGRPGSQLGRSERRRRVVGSKEVFAGTRIPLSTVETYLERGADDARILEAFPRLTPADIEFVRGRVQAS
jgi:DNA-binding transcriptional MerR regulator